MPTLKRLCRHFFMTHLHVQRAFPNRVLSAIEKAIGDAEKAHGGEIRFVLERELNTRDLLHNISPRQRAIHLFGQLGVWDTEHNNGVLIYVLLADRVVEIVADRGYAKFVSNDEWARVCNRIELAFRGGEYERGSIEGIAAVSELVARHYPAPAANELSNRPVVL